MLVRLGLNESSFLPPKLITLEFLIFYPCDPKTVKAAAELHQKAASALEQQLAAERVKPSVAVGGRGCGGGGGIVDLSTGLHTS